MTIFGLTSHHCYNLSSTRSWRYSILRVRSNSWHSMSYISKYVASRCSDLIPSLTTVNLVWHGLHSGVQVIHWSSHVREGARHHDHILTMLSPPFSSTALLRKQLSERSMLFGNKYTELKAGTRCVSSLFIVLLHLCSTSISHIWSAGCCARFFYFLISHSYLDITLYSCREFP